MNIVVKISVAPVLCLAHPFAMTAEPPSVATESVQFKLKGSAVPEDIRQLTDAISASEILRRDLADLTRDGRFTGLAIFPRDQLKGGKASIFGGFIQKTEIVLKAEFLAELKQARQFDVVYGDDILPNNTVFALVHLLHHLKMPLDIRKFSSKDLFVEAMMKTEAAAFIQAWNAMLQVAERNNGGKVLSFRQQGQLLMNARYRFVFIGAMKRPVDSLKFSTTGMVEADERNIQAIAAALADSTLADLE